ncbi:MAG: hypothetical protein OXF79_28225 [Chloroflexi bacterium]|nr:hypothetical protein [Chloroflexota bacterium]
MSGDGERRQRAVMATDAEWERIGRAAAAAGTHRFFLPEHKEVCERMSEPMYDPRCMDDTAWHFVHDEIEIRRAMD